MNTDRRATTVSAAVAALVSLVVLVPASLKAPFEILLADRFLPGAGWAQIVLLAAYGVFVAVKLTGARDTRRIRMAIWLLFSTVFFLQFILGVLGLEKLLMTGALHVPVPAVVIAGPIFRGERFFMPILFLSTVALVGPAWCSYLCYFGAWDGLSAGRALKTKTGARRSSSNPAVGRAPTRRPWMKALRVTLFVVIPAAALAFRAVGIPGRSAALVAVGFGIVGLLVSAAISTRTGLMVHCTGYCPLGLLSNLVGKLSPFRIRLSESCSDCGRCSRSCSYGALESDRIALRRPGLTCTLCGDCLSACSHGSIHYVFGWVHHPTVRAVFLGMVAALHACFLGVARI